MGISRQSGAIIIAILVVIASMAAIGAYLAGEGGGNDNIAPDCCLVPDEDSGEAPLLVTFDIMALDSDGSIASWTIDFDGDGSPECNGTGPPSSDRVHNYSEPGEYNATLTVVDDDGVSNTNVTVIYVLGEGDYNCTISADPSFGVMTPIAVTFTITTNVPEEELGSWVIENFTGGYRDLPNKLTIAINSEGVYDFTLILKDEGKRTLCTNWTSVTILPPGPLTVSFIDVGQGDSTLIQTTDYKNILIDAGDTESGSTVVSFLAAQGVSTIDVFVATNPQADYIGGAAEVFENFDVLSVYTPGNCSTTPVYQSFMEAAILEGCPIYTDEDHDPGDLMNWSEFNRFEILSIDSNSSNPNDTSIVLLMTHGSVKFLFTGAMESDLESEIISSFEFDLDVLKVSHHGSANATSDAFLAQFTPEVGIISVGEDNTYGYPASETLDRLQSHRIATFRTDFSGTILVEVDVYGSGYHVIM